MSDCENELKWIEMLRLELASLTSSYAEAHHKLIRYRALFHSEIAKSIQPLLNAEINAKPQHNYNDKREVASWVNQQVRELGLSTVCPKTGRPAIVAASYRDDQEKNSRFRLIAEDNAGLKRVTTMPHLQNIMLMQDPPRPEGATSRFQHRLRNDPPHR